MDGVNIVGVQFRRAGRIYDFVAGGLNVRVGDDVVVDTDRGPSLAKVAQVSFLDKVKLKEKDLKPIMRLASRRDVEDTLKLSPDAATNFTRTKVEQLGIKMAVLQSEVQFGGNKVIVYFSAPGRVDFRELVKDLASGLKARVELKQVGARDEAKLVGGIGICGREYCCSSFLRDFVPVSIKMAKNQNLALNPSKVSGGCGRLLCCLTYENDLYTELRRKLPPRGTRVKVIEEGIYGDVLKGDVLNQVILIETDGGKLQSVKLKDCEIVERGAGQEDESEADSWGEDIDLAALTALDEDASDRKGNRAPRDNRSPQHGTRPSRSSQPEAPRSDLRDSAKNQGQNRPQPSRSERPPQQPTGRIDSEAESAPSNEQGGARDEAGSKSQDSGSRRGRRRNRNRNRGGGPEEGGGG